VHVRVNTPGPQLAEQFHDHCDHPPSILRMHGAGPEHAMTERPSHLLPPLLGAGSVHVRVWVPGPHVAEQGDHADH